MSGRRADRQPLVAVVNATPASVEPARTALAEGFPEASVWNLLDDRLIGDAEAAGGLTPALSDRMLSLIGHAVRGGADAVLLSCSMYGPVLEQARREHGRPMLSSDEALFAEVSRRRFGHVLLLGHLAPAVEDSVNRLRRVLSSTEGGTRTRVTGRAASGAAAAAARGDLDAVETSLTEAATPGLREVDAVILGMFSLSPAHAGVEKALGLPVLSAPLLAARSLREKVAAETGAFQGGPP
ncbi:aspartate/glutamate racemase family protein [Streptomyces sp. DSM 3412]|uniref:Aspartate/glutamate racemase family protein n=1 Tax=Streptomyces gottesmaniae TaxID=3075518 RepID=A0ABU2YTQ3_9ACTN|nr:aspartate/glutamate racemase family protein [Streptomyces sp. DSM 3412]MDT0567699.1 aspartate/glutamate racemase family protein [Streptomyces sp. DSM 3412]